MGSTMRKVSVVSALFGAAMWMGMTASPALVTSAHAQEISNQDSAAADTSGANGGEEADTDSPDALPINVGGAWSGTITDDKMGAGDFTITFSQKKRKLNGGWTATFSSMPEFLGDFRGRSSSRRVNFQLASGQFDKRSCHIRFKSTTAGGGQILGNYRWADCGKQFKGDKGGTINITPNTVTPTVTQ